MKQWMSVKNLAVFAAIVLALLFPLMGFKMYYVHIGVLSLLHILLALGLNLVAGYAGQLSLAQAAFFGIGAYVSALLMLNLHWSFWLAAPMGALAAGRGPWTEFVACVGSPFGKVVLFGFTWALAYHLINGIRHLVQDAGHGFAIPEFIRSSWISVIGSVVLVVLAWVVVLARWGQA